MYRWSLVAGVVAVAGAMGSVSRAESATDLLEKGIYTEQTGGDLDAAIKIYGQIVAKSEANRAAVAQAYFRLGECYLKKSKPTEARAAFEKLIAQFPDQSDLVAQAKKRIETECPKASRAETKKAVKEAMKTISTGVDGDPRVRKALESLKSFDEQQVVEELLGYLDSTEPTVRRSAIYVLHMGGLKNIDAAVPKLQGLLSHSEDFTRGMAALALGEHKAIASYDAVSQMATKDASGYARRCAAYALGLMGSAQAKPVLEQVLKDSDPLVRGNAEAAIKMLSKENEVRTTHPSVVKTTPVAFTDNVPSDLKEITVTFDRPMMDESWSWTKRGEETFPDVGKPFYDEAKTTCTLPVTLRPGKVYWVGINAPGCVYFQTADHVPAKRHVILFATASVDGKATPIPEGLLNEAKAINGQVGAGNRKWPRPSAGMSSGNELVLTYGNGTLEGRNSINGSGHAVLFERPDDARAVEAVEIYASRYGTPEPPKEDFHIYILNDKLQVLADLPFPYSMISRGDMQWYKFKIPSVEVTKKFAVALSFNPHRTKGVYLGFDKDVDETHSLIGLPDKGFDKPREKYDWMVKVHLSKQASSGKDGSPSTPAGKPGKSLPVSEHRKLLDEQTAADIKNLENPAGAFGELFHVEEEYEAAGDDQKNAMLDKWLADAKSNDRDQRSRAIASLGNVANKKAVPVLVGIIKESGTDNRPRWLAVRALSRIHDKSTVPLLIGLVDHKNWNVRTYAKVALCETTGVYFGDSKKKWQAWWEENKQSQ